MRHLPPPSPSSDRDTGSSDRRSRIDLFGAGLLIAIVIALFLVTTALGAQRVELRAAGISRDTLYVLPGDTVPLQAVGKTAAGGTVTPKDVAFGGNAHCLDIVDDGATRARLVERECGLVPGWVRVVAMVSGTVVEDSVFVTRPFTTQLGSTFGLCLAWQPRALYYTARDTVLALAIQGADRLIAANFIPDTVAPHWAWQGAKLLVQYAAIACMPGYQSRDVTRLTATRWSSANTTIATVDRYGLATWKSQRAPMVITAEWPAR